MYVRCMFHGCMPMPRQRPQSHSIRWTTFSVLVCFSSLFAVFWFHFHFGTATFFRCKLFLVHFFLSRMPFRSRADRGWNTFIFIFCANSLKALSLPHHHNIYEFTLALRRKVHISELKLHVDGRHPPIYAYEMHIVGWSCVAVRLCV